MAKVNKASYSTETVNIFLHFRSKKGPREEEVQEEETEEIIDSEEEEEVAEDFEDEDLEYIKQSGAKFLSGVEDR